MNLQNEIPKQTEINKNLMERLERLQGPNKTSPVKEYDFFLLSLYKWCGYFNVIRGF